MTDNSALTSKSSNGKTGPIAVSTTSREHCAPGCPLAGVNGCYAEAGYYTRMHWDKVTEGVRGLSPELFIKSLSKLSHGSKFRHNVAGDLWHTAGNIVSHLLQSLTAKCKDRALKAWTYTHHARNEHNLIAVREATDNGFTVNLSFESMTEAAKFHKEGFPSVCVVPEDAPACSSTNGVKFRQCPATFDGSPTTCSTCGGGTPLCQLADRDFVITFPVHGGRSKAATSVCSA